MPKTLLLADDSVTIQKVVGLSFANEEIELVTVDNGDDAVARANEIRPDIILADVVMPGLDGYEVCEAINSNEELKHIPVLLLSGTFEPFDEAHANSAGAAGHITKPFEAQSLVDRVNSILANPPAPVAEEPAAFAVPEEAPAQPARVDPGELTGAFDAAMISDDPLASPDLSFDDEIAPAAPVEAAEPVAPAALAEAPAALAEESLPFEDESSTFAIPDDGLSFADDAEGADILGQSISTEEQIAKQHVADSMDQTIAFIPDGDTALDSSTAVASLDDGSDWALGDSGLDVPPVVEDIPSPDDAPTFDDLAVSGHAVTDHETFVIGEDFGTTAPPTGVENPNSADFADPCEPAEPAFADDLSLETETVELTSFETAEGSFETAEGSFETAEGSFEMAEGSFEMGGDSFEMAEGSIEPAESTLGAAEIPFAGEIEQPWEAANAAPPVEQTEPAAMDALGSFEAPPAFEESPIERASLEEEFQEPPAPVPSDAAPTNIAAPEFQKHLHDTLEKLAWEAFSDVTEKLVKDALKHVEAIAWEVIPQMAEAMVKEEIRRMKGEEEDGE